MFVVEWSNSASFEILEGESIVEAFDDIITYNIENLTSGRQYSVRVSACNMKGYGETTPTDPPNASPSSKSSHARDTMSCISHVGLLSKLFCFDKMCDKCYERLLGQD